MVYKVNKGQTVWDVALCSQGSYVAVDEILTVNNIHTYTPVLVVDTSLSIGDTIYNNEAVGTAKRRPFNNVAEVDDEDVYILINNLIAQLEQ